jgi:cytidine deaminase
MATFCRTAWPSAVISGTCTRDGDHQEITRSDEFRLDTGINCYYAEQSVHRNVGIDSSMPKRKRSRVSNNSRQSPAALIEVARGAAKNAYAPYSQFKVGAALLTTGGEIILGCNVENASYGMTNCAERTAIFSAVSQFGPKLEIRAIAVVSAGNAPCAPCGACRQVIYEFGPEATVFFLSANGWEELPIMELLPYGFRLK